MNDYWDSIPVPSQACLMRILHLTAFEYTEQVWWRTNPEGKLVFFVNCNDVFAWGGSDAEAINDENIDDLEQTLRECEIIVGKYRAEDAFLLWVARQRRCRPQGAMYKNLDRELWPLFDAAGPEREISVTNPKPRPE